MIAAYLADVGDGMSAGIRTISGKSIQIDCGSQEAKIASLSSALYRINPDLFVLSHFHSDHYNGLLISFSSMSQTPPLSIEGAVYPRLPEFDDRSLFMRYLLAMNQRVLGGVSGSMEMDFLNLLARVNSRPFKHRSLSAGDSFIVEGSKFRVLWPPKVIRRNDTIRQIKNAISDFNSALEEDEILKTIYEELENERIIWPYLDDKRGRDVIEARNEADDLFRMDFARHKLPEATNRANKSLRKAANHFSLAFHEDNRLLFLGDSENYELSQVVKKLKRKRAIYFQVFITPHHGTHWHVSLNDLKCFSALCSVGSKLFKNLRPEYKEIAEECYATFFSGDVILSGSMLTRWFPWDSRYLFPFF
jgi:beta-lactamase superfamily II metal-dependent hydrolase